MQVYRGVRLSDRLKLLHAEGVTNGAHLVMLRKRPQAPRAPDSQPKRPTLEQVEAAVRAEAERQGCEMRPVTQPPRQNAARHFEARLQSIMNALQGMGGGRADELHRQMASALRQAELLPNEAGGAALAPPQPPAEVLVPEPSAAHIANLQDMGFSAAAARRALLLSRGNVNAAVNHLVAHSADGNAEAEPTPEELRCADSLILLF